MASAADGLRSVSLRVVGPEDPGTEYLAAYCYQAGQYRVELFGVILPGDTVDEALGRGGFPVVPALVLGGAGVTVSLFVSLEARPGEYLVRVAFAAGVVDGGSVVGIYVPDWPSLSALLRLELAPLASACAAALPGAVSLGRVA